MNGLKANNSSPAIFDVLKIVVALSQIQNYSEMAKDAHSNGNFRVAAYYQNLANQIYQSDVNFNFMKFIFILIAGAALLIFGIACNNNTERSASGQSSHLSRDSSKQEAKVAPADTGNSRELQNIVQDYIMLYGDTIKIDTSFNRNEKKITVSFRHFCTYDSLIHLSDKSVGIYGLKEFITHDFKSILKITKGGEIVIDTTISKEIFNDEMFSEERLNGVLLYPSLSFSYDKMFIDYSISVPLTDIGIGVSLECKYNGGIAVKKN